MSIVKHILFTIFFFTSTFVFGQEKTRFPYKGGIEKFEKEINSTLLVEANDSGRIYFVEIFYQKETKKILSHIHGKQKEDITTSLITDFFTGIENNWEKKIIKKTAILVPLFISPLKIDNNGEVANTDISLFAKHISGSFIPKKYFLSKPIYIFNQGVHIDRERN